MVGNVHGQAGRGETQGSDTACGAGRGGFRARRAIQVSDGAVSHVVRTGRAARLDGRTPFGAYQGKASLAELLEI